jgi:tripartite-type tricarboxylate transporter receptor subunit TctC
MERRFFVIPAMVMALANAEDSTGAHAADYPTSSIRLVIPVAPGGGADIIARLLAEHMKEMWKQTVVVENKPGANGLLAPAEVAKAPADGYTLLFGTPSLATVKVLVKNPTFDTLKDLTPISQIMVSPYIIAVNSSVPAKNLRELIDYSKANPTKLNYGSVAGGAILAVELFKGLSGAQMAHVLYRGSAPTVSALAANEIQVAFDAMITLKSSIDAGTVRPIGVTGAQRAPHMPNLPTAIESGVPGYDITFWFGVLGPAGLPDDVKNRVARAVSDFVKLPATVERFNQLGYVPLGSTPAEFSKRIQEDVKSWEAAAKFAKIEPQ